MLAIYTHYLGKTLCTVEPRCNEGPMDSQNMFAITRFRYIEVLFTYFTITRVKETVFFNTDDFVAQRFDISRFHCTNVKLYNLAWWRNDPLQSISKSTEQIEKSRNIARSQITAHIFWNLSKWNGPSSEHVVAFLKIVSQMHQIASQRIFISKTFRGTCLRTLLTSSWPSATPPNGKS